MFLLDAVELHSAYLRRRRRSGRTIEFYRSWLISLDALLLFHDLEAVTLSDLRRWIDSLIDRGLKHDTSVRDAAMTAKVFFKWCVAEDLLSVSPAARLELPDRRRPCPDALTLSQVEYLITSCKHFRRNVDRNAALVAFISEAGTRLQETAALTIDRLHVAEGYAIIAAGKGDKPRFVFFGETTRALFDRFSFGSDVVFGLSGCGIQEMLRRLSDFSGLHVSAHLLRRSCATLRAGRGIDAFSLQQMMGWSSVEIARHYVDLGALTAAAVRTSPLSGK
jgi:site-specific recombinase XerD